MTTINSAHKIQNWRVSEECTQSDHNLILFNLKIHSKNRNSNRTASDSTRKYATKVGNWNMFHQKTQQTGKQWTDLVNSAKTKEQLDKSITEIWYKLKEISKRCFPPFLPKTNYVPWWSPKLNALRKQVNALKRRVKRGKNSDLKRSPKHASRFLKPYTKQNSLEPNYNPGRNFARSALKIHP